MVVVVSSCLLPSLSVFFDSSIGNGGSACWEALRQRSLPDCNILLHCQAGLSWFLVLNAAGNGRHRLLGSVWAHDRMGWTHLICSLSLQKHESFAQPSSEHSCTECLNVNIFTGASSAGP